MSITTITRSLSERSIINGLKGVEPEIPVTCGIDLRRRNPLADVDPYFAGVRFHALLRRISDHDRLSPGERAMLPWLSAMRAELRSAGVTRITPEVAFPGRDGLPAGICDLVVQGGPADFGAIEVKVCDHLPAAPSCQHILQVGGYAAALLANHQQHRVWAALVYVCFREELIRLFCFRKTDALIRNATALLAEEAA